jgi:5-formyltetrahydrofolate cyclo-ligase
MGHFLAAIELAPNAVVAAYWPMRNELDPRPLMTALGARGCRCALPVIVAPEAPLMFRSWRPGDALDVGLFDTRQPTPEAAALEPDVVIAPLVAFDESGHRLGYGGGYYDRTLEKLRRGAGALAVGYAYAGQLVAALPQGQFDQKLDWLVSDKGVRAFV